MYYALYSLEYIEYNVIYSVKYLVQCAIYSVQYIEYSAMYSVKCMVYHAIYSVQYRIQGQHL